MNGTRILTGVGFASLVLAAGSLLVGGAGFPWFTIGALALGAILLVSGLMRLRGLENEGRDTDPGRGDRAARIAFIAMCGMGGVTAAVAILVAQGEAKGHATSHLVTALVGLGLFAALAFRWHPRPGTGTATYRGLLLCLLALAVAGSYIESLGGAGYDRANSGRRIPALAGLHDVGLLFGGVLFVAIPVAVVTGIVLLVLWSARKRREVPATS